MNCCWHEFDADGACNAPAEVFRRIPLCPRHRIAFLNSQGSVARASARTFGLSAFPGFCYFMLMPDGLVKIGYSGTERTLKQRINRLSKDSGAPCILLAKIAGGFVAEAVMHHRFEASRVPENGERFHYTPDMAKFVASVRDE